MAPRSKNLKVPTEKPSVPPPVPPLPDVPPPLVSYPSLIPAYGVEELALTHFGHNKAAVVYGASTLAKEYWAAKRALEPLIREPNHPYHAAAQALWEEIHQKAVENVRALLMKQEAPSRSSDPRTHEPASVEAWLGIATLHQWPEVATTLLLQDWDAGDRWALIRAGNIDQNTDFLALHLRSLLFAPELRASALEFMLLLSAQTFGFGQDRLCESPTRRHLTAALATGELPVDELAEALDRLAQRGALSSRCTAQTLEQIRTSARRYGDLVKNVADERGIFSEFVRRMTSKEKLLEAFLKTEEETLARSQARDLLLDAEEMAYFCRRLTQIAYLEKDRTLVERHRAEERLVLLGVIGGERLLSDPERTLADWLDPHRLIGAERDLILTVVAIEDLRSGGAAARVLRGAIQNPLFREQALELMAEVVFRNPPGFMEEQLLEALANGELGTKEEGLALLLAAAQESLGPTMSEWFLLRLTERLANYSPGTGLIPFFPTASEEKRLVPFLASTLEHRVQSSLYLLKHRLKGEIPFGLRDAVLHLFHDASTEDVLVRYRALIDPEPLLNVLRSGPSGDQEVVRQITCDLVVLNEAIQRMDRMQREALRAQMPILIGFRILTLQPTLMREIQVGEHIPAKEKQERLLRIGYQKYTCIVQDDNYSGRFWGTASVKIRDWAYERLREIFDPKFGALLIGLLRDAHPPVQKAAAELVQGDPRYVELLLEMLRSGDVRSRRGAFLGLKGVTDPAIRYEIAQTLREGGEIAEAAVSALGGLERILLEDPDERIVEIAGRRLFQIDPASIDDTYLRAGLERLTRSMREHSLERSKRYYRVVLALARVPRKPSLKAAFEAVVRTDSLLSEADRKVVWMQLTWRVLHQRYREKGCSRALQGMADFDPRTGAIFVTLDQFGSVPMEESSFVNLYMDMHVKSHYDESTPVLELDAGLKLLAIAAVTPGSNKTTHSKAKEALHQLYMESLQLLKHAGDLERSILVIAAYLGKQPLSEVLKLRKEASWLTTEPKERGILVLLYTQLQAHPERLEEGMTKEFWPELEAGIAALP